MEQEERRKKKGRSRKQKKGGRWVKRGMKKNERKEKRGLKEKVKKEREDGEMRNDERGRRMEGEGRRVIDGRVNLKITESTQYEYLKRKGKTPAYLPI